jgi:hypothetical protein
VPCLLASADSHGFQLTSDGNLTMIDIPGAIMTGATRINARGDIVGDYMQANSFPKGFLLRRHAAWLSESVAGQQTCQA